MDKFRSWLTSEMEAEAGNSKSHDYMKRKSANARYEELQSGVRLLDEYAKHQESAHLRLHHREP